MSTYSAPRAKAVKKIINSDMPFNERWLDRRSAAYAVIAQSLISLGDPTARHHLSRANAHLDLLINVRRNAEYARVFRLVETELAYAFHLRIPRP